MKQGFTLIELLVVVLIIGILAAVAVPQYQRAVAHTQISNFRTLVMSLEKSVQSYYAENSSWPTSFAQLDLSLPANLTTKYTATNLECFSNADLFCCIRPPKPSAHYGSITCGRKDYRFAFEARYANDNGTPFATTIQVCYAPAGKKVCPGRLMNAKNGFITPDGGQSGSSYQMKQ